MPNDPQTTLIETGIKEAGETARHYMDKIVAGGLEQTGGIIADQIAFWRWKNKIEIVLKMKAFLESKGIAPRKALPAVVLPLLDAASLEEDPDMKARWEGLLTSAVIDPDSVPPSFPRILSELSPLEARMLDCVVERGEQSSGYHGLNAAQTSDYLDVSLSVAFVCRDNLLRLNLLTIGHAPLMTDAERGMPFTGTICLTPLGYAFLSACRRTPIGPTSSGSAA